MAVIGYAAVVGIFEQRSQAEQAVAELKGAGFCDEQITYLSRGRVKLREALPSGRLLTWMEKRTHLPLAGGIIGGLSGALFSLAVALCLSLLGGQPDYSLVVAVLEGTLLSALGGGFLGALLKGGLIGWGTQYVEEPVPADQTIVMVRTLERQHEAAHILRRYGARDALVPRATETAALAALHLAPARQPAAGLRGSRRPPLIPWRIH
jgi:hypothetical protein